jgi:hypothetical protein
MSSAIISTSIASDFGTLGTLEVSMSGQVRSTTIERHVRKKTILASGNGPTLAYRLAGYEPNPEPLRASPLKRDSLSPSTVLVFPVP